MAFLENALAEREEFKNSYQAKVDEIATIRELAYADLARAEAIENEIAEIDLAKLDAEIAEIKSYLGITVEPESVEVEPTSASPEEN